MVINPAQVVIWQQTRDIIDVIRTEIQMSRSLSFIFQDQKLKNELNTVLGKKNLVGM